MRILLELSYLGSAYYGWQIQPDVPTVQGEINRALSVLYGCEILTQGSSRTDRGVHAKSFFCHFDTDRSFDISRLPMALNANLPRDISVHSARVVDEDFHARFNVKCKTYEYLIWNNPTRNALYSDRALHWWYGADVEAMDKAAKALCGTHDFAAFKAQRVHIIHHVLPAVFLAEIDPCRTFCHGAAVTEVVIADDGDAVFAEEIRKGGVTVDVFCHTVSDLQHSADLALGSPLRGADGGVTVMGGEVKLGETRHGI